MKNRASPEHSRTAPYNMRSESAASVPPKAHCTRARAAAEKIKIALAPLPSRKARGRAAAKAAAKRSASDDSEQSESPAPGRAVKHRRKGAPRRSPAA